MFIYVYSIYLYIIYFIYACTVYMHIYAYIYIYMHIYIYHVCIACIYIYMTLTTCLPNIAYGDWGRYLPYLHIAKGNIMELTLKKVAKPVAIPRLKFRSCCLHFYSATHKTKKILMFFLQVYITPMLATGQAMAEEAEADAATWRDHHWRCTRHFDVNSGIYCTIC